VPVVSTNAIVKRTILPEPAPLPGSISGASYSESLSPNSVIPVFEILPLPVESSVNVLFLPAVVSQLAYVIGLSPV